jgi:two-component system, cell cycle response regulator DivK
MLLKDKRIFIVEDNNTNRSVMQLLLEQEGAIIAFERWGRSVCERLESFAPVDIVLLDLRLPDHITGYEILDQIRVNSAFDSVPVVAVSAADPEEEIQRAHQKGFSGYISKPIKLHLFANQIASVLNGKQVWYSG